MFTVLRYDYFLLLCVPMYLCSTMCQKYDIIYFQLLTTKTYFLLPLLFRYYIS